MRKSHIVALCALVALICSVQGQPELSEYLSDPKYAPLIQIVLTEATSCISDPAILGGNFELSEEGCPGLYSLLDDVYNEVPNPTITCEPVCVENFNRLTPECLSELRTAFENAEERYSEPGTAFFIACDETGGFGAPSVEPPEAEEKERVAAPAAEEIIGLGNSATSAVITPIALFLLINAILMLSTF